jgi:hypothetical protein
MGARPGSGNQYRPFVWPNWNRVTVLALFLLATLSLGQATRSSFRGLLDDELVRAEKAAAGGLPPGVAIPSTIDMPIDHFNESDPRTYKNRYWVNATYYKEGGPVFL